MHFSYKKKLKRRQKFFSNLMTRNLCLHFLSLLPRDYGNNNENVEAILFFFENRIKVYNLVGVQNRKGVFS